MSQSQTQTWSVHSAPSTAERRGVHWQKPRPSQQRGLGLGKVMLLLVLVVFFVSLGIKMLPSYLTYYQVRSVMDRVVERPDMVGAGPRAVLAAVTRQLGIDSIRSVDAKAFRVAREGEDIVLSVDYQVQEHVGYNVDVVMHFEHAVTLPRP